MLWYLPQGVSSGVPKDQRYPWGRVELLQMFVEVIEWEADPQSSEESW